MTNMYESDRILLPFVVVGIFVCRYPCCGYNMHVCAVVLNLSVLSLFLMLLLLVAHV